MIATKAYVIEPPQFMSSSLALSVDILETANRVAGLLGVAAPFDVARVKPSDVLGKPASADIIILPGLEMSSESEIRSALQKKGFDDVARAIFTLIGPQTVIATSCTGVFLLGKMGLIDHKKVTTTWWLAPLLHELFPKAQLKAGEIVVQDGDLFTAGAALAHIDLMLALAERFAGFAISEECRRFLLVDDRRSQVPYLSVATLVAADPLLRKAESHVRKNIRSKIETRDLAEASGLGLRTFARRLTKVTAMTPTQFLQTIRVLQAIKLAKTTHLTSDEIAVRVGYSDATSLRRVVRKQTMRTLEAYRNK